MIDSVNNRLRRLAGCSSCAAAFFCPTGSPDSAQICPPGHYCPAGSTTWSDKNCGRGNYCAWGSSAPISCGPYGGVDAAPHEMGVRELQRILTEVSSWEGS